MNEYSYIMNTWLTSLDGSVSRGSIFEHILFNTFTSDYAGITAVPVLAFSVGGWAGDKVSCMHPGAPQGPAPLQDDGDSKGPWSQSARCSSALTAAGRGGKRGASPVVKEGSQAADSGVSSPPGIRARASFTAVRCLQPHGAHFRTSLDLAQDSTALSS